MKFKLSNFNNTLFCFSLLSIFFPVKIYPIIFLIASISFLLERKKIILSPWIYFLVAYSVYAIASFIISGYYDELRVTNFYKILINFFFLITAINWLYQKDVSRLIVMVDYTFHFTLFLVFVQLMLYHKDSNFQYLLGVSSSNEGTDIYNPNLYFWGLDTKNLFGARIATVGFPYILIGAARFKKVSLSRICIVCLLAFFSMSRTPILALILGILYMFWNIPGKSIKISLFSIIAIATPAILNNVFRLQTVTESNDGMGIRLMYWGAFFLNFNKISIFGNGFLAADKFLGQYALFYLGEPNIHNTFLNNYLDFGIWGLTTYTLFLIYLFKYSKQTYNNKKYWITAFIPLLATMMVLFPGYDNDIIIYLVLVSIVGQLKTFNYNNLSFSYKLNG